MKQFFSSKQKVRHILFWAVSTVVLCSALIYPFINRPTLPLTPLGTLVQAEPVPNFAKYRSVKRKKKAFFAYLKPEIARQNAVILQQRSWLLAVRYDLKNSQAPLNAFTVNKLDELAEIYEVDVKRWTVSKLDELLIKVDIIPTALILVQAANESAWGTSRFAKDGYNFFGLWCFKKGCGFVPRQRDDGADHEVAKFKNLEQGVWTYINNLNRHPAYNELRLIRAQLRKNHQPIEARALAEGLLKYSERGQAYVDEIISMINVNQPLM